MKLALYTLAGLGAAALIAPAASAQVYAGAGYTVFQADTGSGTADLGAVMGRVGYKMNPFFGAEGEFSVGVQDESFNVLGTDVNVGLDSEYGVFAVGWLPVPFLADLYGRVGYAHLSVDASAAGIGSISGDGDGLAYGAGLQLNGIPFTKLRIEYTRYQPDDGDVDSLGVSALLQF
jgi:hypothetical protein